jgi:hypothetical protein
MSARPTVNEQSACYADVHYYGPDGAAYLPSAVRYKLENITTRDLVKPWTTITPDYFNRVTVSAVENTMRTSIRREETMQVTFEITTALGDVQHKYAQYDLIRISRPPTLPL